VANNGQIFWELGPIWSKEFADNFRFGSRLLGCFRPITRLTCHRMTGLNSSPERMFGIVGIIGVADFWSWCTFLSSFK
jgi:hypothetical protein